MRPLVHPSIEDITVEGILHALSDPVRAAIYAELAICSGATCSNFLKISDRDIPKSTLSQHFRALRDAGLIRSERQGVEMRNSTRCVEVEQRFPGLVATIMKAHQLQAMERMRTDKRKPAAKKRQVS
ncbi:ArsR/SmtB family transcription factor [Dyella caseinilytica]|uniref:Helix-turn-helix transcriptional regulator n=1 Tax=Dyella caseinilytica TaxID=1849581 RepID=A0ABX7GWE9_9GAMM|nr:helix-turn-helix domain-containing protein [Dyella caseinilytica]QRN54057.1 helix-turn-helix transcriptional regulator [Dyella caseinilytica]GFZ91261.1 transcriptional regulator [Dyella caseinilytica]